MLHLNGNIFAYSINFIEHEIHVFVGILGKAMDYHSEKVAQILVLEWLITNHQCALLNELFLDHWSNPMQNSFVSRLGS